MLMAFDMLSPAIRAQVTLRQCLRLHLDAHARPTSHDAMIAHRLLHAGGGEPPCPAQTADRLRAAVAACRQVGCGQVQLAGGARPLSQPTAAMFSLCRMAVQLPLRLLSLGCVRTHWRRRLGDSIPRQPRAAVFDWEWRQGRPHRLRHCPTVPPGCGAGIATWVVLNTSQLRRRRAAHHHHHSFASRCACLRLGATIVVVPTEICNGTVVCTA